MDEKLFEFRFEQDEKYLRDYLKYAYFGLPARKAIIAFCILVSAAFIGLATYSTIRDPSTAWSKWLLAAVLIAAYAWMNGFRYFKSVRTTKKRFEEMYRGKPLIVEGYVTDTELHMLNTANNAEDSVAISSLSKVRQTDAFVVTNTAARIFFAVPKSGFTKGTPEGLVEFLHGKGVR